jgi:hypothetical protein
LTPPRRRGRRGQHGFRTVTVARITVSGSASGIFIGEIYGDRQQFFEHDIYNGRIYNSTKFGVIVGRVTNDADRFDAPESAAAGRTVYLDVNNNHRMDVNERRVTTDVNGIYEFAQVIPGNYRLRQVLPKGFLQSMPTRNYSHRVAIGPGHVDSGNNFSTFRSVSIGGTVFRDFNANGVRDAGEAGIAGRDVFVETGELWTPSSAHTVTDASGHFSFVGLPPFGQTVSVAHDASEQWTTGWQSQLTLAPGESNLTLAFGIE